MATFDRLRVRSVAATVPRSDSVAASERMDMDIAHTAIRMSDLKASREFFVDTLRLYGLDGRRSYTRRDSYCRS